MESVLLEDKSNGQGFTNVLSKFISFNFEFLFKSFEISKKTNLRFSSMQCWRDELKLSFNFVKILD